MESTRGTTILAESEVVSYTLLRLPSNIVGDAARITWWEDFGAKSGRLAKNCTGSLVLVGARARLDTEAGYLFKK
jgi:hypothetical protein